MRMAESGAVDYKPANGSNDVLYTPQHMFMNLLSGVWGLLVDH